MARTKKWVLVTGVSDGGLGDGLVQAFMEQGINVIATSLDIKLLDYLKPAGGVTLEKLQLDVSQSSSIADAVKATQKITGGKLDILVNNAGYGYMMPLIDASIGDIKKNFDVNVFGLLEMTQAFFPMLRVAKGMVVMQSSSVGLPGVCQPFIGTYSASKAAVTDFSNTLRVELMPFDVKVGSNNQTPDFLAGRTTNSVLKVITMFTGDVETKFWVNIKGGFQGIPDDSPYALMKEHVEGMMQGSEKLPGAPPASSWGKVVVGDLMKKNPPIIIRRGYLATVIWLMSVLVPTWMFDKMFAHTAKVTELKAKIRTAEKAKVI